MVDGANVRYLSTPLRYRWMGITPTLPLELARSHRPDVVHVFGFRDPVTTGVAAWCRIKRVPYVFEPLGMFEPRLRKVLLKRALDATLYRGVARGAAGVVVASEREGEAAIACGVPPEKVHVRGNGFPAPTQPPADGDLRARLGISGGCAARPLRRPYRGREGHRASAGRRQGAADASSSWSPGRTIVTGPPSSCARRRRTPALPAGSTSCR